MYPLHGNQVEVDPNAKQMSQVLKNTRLLQETAVKYNMFM